MTSIVTCWAHLPSASAGHPINGPSLDFERAKSARKEVNRAKGTRSPWHKQLLQMFWRRKSTKPKTNNTKVLVAPDRNNIRSNSMTVCDAQMFGSIKWRRHEMCDARRFASVDVGRWQSNHVKFVRSYIHRSGWCPINLSQQVFFSHCFQKFKATINWERKQKEFIYAALAAFKCYFHCPAPAFWAKVINHGRPVWAGLSVGST